MRCESFQHWTGDSYDARHVHLSPPWSLNESIRCSLQVDTESQREYYSTVALGSLGDDKALEEEPQTVVLET